eukprot:7381715-Prymnesium_polylepis.1
MEAQRVDEVLLARDHCGRPQQKVFVHAIVGDEVTQAVEIAHVEGIVETDDRLPPCRLRRSTAQRRARA